mgnify:CR=1 FL=1
MKVLMLHGINHNMFGKRDPKQYGTITLAQIDEKLVALGKELGAEVQSFQTNHEGELLDWIHAARGRCAGIVINPAAWTHTSVALRDALVASELPVIEVHLSNVHKREPFRHHSYFSAVAVGVICGLGASGYRLALESALEQLAASAKS